MRKYAPKMKEKAFLSILNKKFPGGACPRTPLAAWALWAQVTRPKGVYIRVTPVTTKATAVQNSTENPVYSGQFTLSPQLIILINLLYSPSCTAPQFLLETNPVYSSILSGI